MLQVCAALSIVCLIQLVTPYQQMKSNDKLDRTLTIWTQIILSQ